MNRSAKKLFLNRENYMGLVKVLVYSEDTTSLEYETYTYLVDIMDKFCEVMTILGRKEDFIEQDSVMAQYKISSLIIEMKKQFNHDAISNYFHILESGEVFRLLIRHKNLYKYCNEGSEAVNGQVQATYHRRTNRKLVLPQFKKILRRIIAWKVGFQSNELLELIKILKEKKENYKEEIKHHAYARTFASDT
jgi:hypothetical protein